MQLYTPSFIKTMIREGDILSFNKHGTYLTIQRQGVGSLCWASRTKPENVSSPSGFTSKFALHGCDSDAACVDIALLLASITGFNIERIHHDETLLNYRFTR
ncbi:MAG TPA: hypothetical protein VFQ60_01365 [Patescibacteria group bacterium]|nr:hypothetical protein [Patescibacteria group bacterium]